MDCITWEECRIILCLRQEHSYNGHLGKQNCKETHAHMHTHMYTDDENMLYTTRKRVWDNYMQPIVKIKGPCHEAGVYIFKMTSCWWTCVEFFMTFPRKVMHGFIGRSVNWHSGLEPQTYKTAKLEGTPRNTKNTEAGTTQLKHLQQVPIQSMITSLPTMENSTPYKLIHTTV